MATLWGGARGGVELSSYSKPSPNPSLKREGDFGCGYAAPRFLWQKFLTYAILRLASTDRLGGDFAGFFVF